MNHKLRRFVQIARSEGFSSALKRSIRHVAQKAPAVVQPRQDPISHYNFILGEERGFGLRITPDNVPVLSMTWVIPDFTASSGGHINILRMMKCLMEQGFKNQHIVVMEPHRWHSVEEAQSALNKAFGDSGITISLGVDTIEPCHYLVATSWQTAYWVSKYRDTLHRLYFVQDFEPYFYARGSEYALAENTYRLGLVGITAGNWLSEKLATEYGMKTFAYTFACDTDLYKPSPKRASKNRNIFFYARPVTQRRCFELGLLALAKVCERNPDVAVIFAGWDVSGYEIPFHHLNAGVLQLSELPDLYSQCDVALVLSSTNLSLLPMELASCGCPIVMNDGPSANWLLSNNEVTYCEFEVQSITDALEQVLNNPDKAKQSAAAALRVAHASSWEEEAGKVAGFLKTLKP